MRPRTDKRGGCRYFSRGWISDKIGFFVSYRTRRLQYAERVRIQAPSSNCRGVAGAYTYPMTHPDSVATALSDDPSIVLRRSRLDHQDTMPPTRRDRTLR